MAKESWSAKLKRELAETKQELADLKNKIATDVKEDVKSFGYGDIAIAAGGLIIGFLAGLLF